MDEYRIPDWFYDEWDTHNIWKLGSREVSEAGLKNLISLLDRGGKERDLQTFLQNTPQLWLGTMRTGHGNWVIPKQKLGIHHETDFLIAEGHSGGLSWRCVELECPTDRPYNMDGTESRALREAINQIRDWRVWLRENTNSARKPKAEKGHGLAQISEHVWGEIVIGRRERYPQKFVELREHYFRREHITIMSYDRLVERAAFELIRFSGGRREASTYVESLRGSVLQ